MKPIYLFFNIRIFILLLLFYELKNQKYYKNMARCSSIFFENFFFFLFFGKFSSSIIGCFNDLFLDETFALI